MFTSLTVMLLSAFADENILVDRGFEQTARAIPLGAWRYQPSSSGVWDFTALAGVSWRTGAFLDSQVAGDGNAAGFLQGHLAEIAQTVRTLVPGRRYRLTWLERPRPGDQVHGQLHVIVADASGVRGVEELPVKSDSIGDVPKGWQAKTAEFRAWHRHHRIRFQHRVEPMVVDPRHGNPTALLDAIRLVPLVDDFPRPRASGSMAAALATEEMGRLGALHYRLTERVRPSGTIWFPWMVKSTLWQWVGDGTSRRVWVDYWRERIRDRYFDPEGYVSTHQHAGLAHPLGWPFPTWAQSAGMGWHFSLTRIPYAAMLGHRALEQPPVDWQCHDLVTKSYSTVHGWTLESTGDQPRLVLPPVKLAVRALAYIRVEIQSTLPQPASLTLEWSGHDHASPGQTISGSMQVTLPSNNQPVTDLVIPVYRSPQWTGEVTQMTLHFPSIRPSHYTLRSVFTAVDTRHNVNNPNFVVGLSDFVRWTGDLTFLREQLPRARQALEYARREFSVARHGVVTTPWPGHDGRSSLHFVDGKKYVFYDRGLGNNYWDLVPFGGQDAYATMAYYDATLRLAELEQLTEECPELGLPACPRDRSASFWRSESEQVKKAFAKTFWNPETKRFVGSIDVNGVAHDFGFVFLNTEAVALGLANPDQTRAIYDWLDGKRRVLMDTSTGPDIYHWRFGPRSTTKRNVTYYTFAWHNPEQIEWGNQVQDGGAVLGFSAFDLIARQKNRSIGRGDQRVEAIARWFSDVEKEGGYRVYYLTPGRGTLQGGGPPGGLGLDEEFAESLLVPTVLVSDFLGFQPTLQGFRLVDQLPAGWDSFGQDRIAYRDHVLTIRVDSTGWTLSGWKSDKNDLRVEVPVGDWTVSIKSPTGNKLTHVSRSMGGYYMVRMNAGEVLSIGRSVTPPRNR